jgi:hypothetical protein
MKKITFLPYLYKKFRLYSNFCGIGKDAVGKGQNVLALRFAKQIQKNFKQGFFPLNTKISQSLPGAE